MYGVGFSEHTSHPGATLKSWRSTTARSARSCTLRCGPSSADPCVPPVLDVDPCDPIVPILSDVAGQVACFLASTTFENRQRFYKVHSGMCAPSALARCRTALQRVFGLTCATSSVIHHAAHWAGGVGSNEVFVHHYGYRQDGAAVRILQHSRRGHSFVRIRSRRSSTGAENVYLCTSRRGRTLPCSAYVLAERVITIGRVFAF